MNLFRRSRRDSEERSLTRETIPPTMLADVPGDTRVSPSNALTIADAYSCVRVLADAAGSLPLIVYRRTGEGRERIENRTAELLQNPSPTMTRSGLVAQIVAHLNLFGNCYLGKFKDADGEIEQLVCLRPSSVTVEVKAGKPLYTYIDPFTGRKSVLTTADLIHLKALTTDGVVGLSPVTQCRLALGLSADLTQYASRFFSNDARPSGILKVPTGPIAQDQIENLRRDWEARHAGVKQAHRIAILSGDVSFDAISMPPEDSQFLEQRQWSSAEVARCFRIPPALIGAPTGDSLTYATVEQQSLHFVTYSLRPWLVTIEQALSADADLFRGNSYAEFLIDGLLRSDALTRSQVYTAALQGGWMTVAEVRERQNLPPLPNDAAPVPAPNGNGRAMIGVT